MLSPARRSIRRKYKPTSRELNEAILGILEEESIDCREILNIIQQKHRNWLVNERRVVKFVKRYEAQQQRFSFIENKTEVSSLTTSIGEGAGTGRPNMFRRYLRSNSLNFRRELESPIDSTISVVYEEATVFNDPTECQEDDIAGESGELDGTLHGSTMLSLYLDESNEEHKKGHGSTMLSLYLDESNEEEHKKGHGISCWGC